jgi:hypothetical protein
MSGDATLARHSKELRQGGDADADPVYQSGPAMTHPHLRPEPAVHSVRAPIFWGLVFGAAQAALPLAIWWLPQATVHALSITLIAAVYIGFAVADGRPTVIATEAAIVALFVVIAAMAVTATAWLLVLGYAGHGLKDYWQERHHFVANTRWWPPFCATVGRYLVGLRVDLRVEAAEQERDRQDGQPDHGMAARGPSEQRVDQQDHEDGVQAPPVDADGERDDIDNREQAECDHHGRQWVRPPPEQGGQERHRHRHGCDAPDQVVADHSFEHRHRDQRGDERPVPPHPRRRVGGARFGPQRTSRVSEHDPSVREAAGLRIGRKNETQTVRSAGREWPEIRCTRPPASGG